MPAVRHEVLAAEASRGLPRPVEDAARDLVFDRHGDAAAPAVLFLHGITGSRHYWDGVAARLARRRQLVLPDLMGFGSSPKPAVRYDVEAQVACLRAFVERLRLDGTPVDVVAHSLGALVALDYACRFPGHVRRAVLLSVPCYADSTEAHEHFLAGSANYRRLLGRASWTATARSWLRAGPVMALRYAFAFNARIAADSRSWTFHSLTSTIQHSLLTHRVQRTAAELARLAAESQPRLLLLHGERDQVAPLRRVRDLQAALPLAPLEVLRGTGHHPFRTHRRWCIARIERFLEHDGPTPHAAATVESRGSAA